jgi:cell division protein FtsB
MTLRRSVVAFYALLFVALTLFAGLFFLRTYGEYHVMAAREEANQEIVADLQVRLAEQQRTVSRLRNDPAFIERAIREQLHYARPGETIFRFDN